MRVYLHSLKQLLPPKSVKSREILQKFELIVVQGQVIDLGANRKRIRLCNFLLVNNGKFGTYLLPF